MVDGKTNVKGIEGQNWRISWFDYSTIGIIQIAWTISGCPGNDNRSNRLQLIDHIATYNKRSCSFTRC